MTNLAEEVTTAVLGVLKRGGDNYNIYVAVKAALAATPAVGGERIKEALNAFSDFINEPPQYEDKRMVRDYRHELARKWVPVFEAIQAAMATPAAPTAQPAAPLRGRECLAKTIYETEPHYEPGEYVDGFQVSPGGSLSWEQAKARDAEFGDDPLMGKITEFAYRCADAILSAAPSEQPAAGCGDPSCKDPDCTYGKGTNYLAQPAAPPFQPHENCNCLMCLAEKSR